MLVGIDAHVILRWRPLTFLLLRATVLRWTTSGRLDDWLRELSRAGLSTTERQELLQRLSQTIGCRTRYFPDSPLAYVERVKEFLLSAFLPQKGPLSIAGSPDEALATISRSRAWEFVYFRALHVA